MLRALRHWTGQPREVEDTPTGEMLELGWKGILIVGSVWVGLEGDTPLLEVMDLGLKGISHISKCWSWLGSVKSRVGRE